MINLSEISQPRPPAPPVAPAQLRRPPKRPLGSLAVHLEIVAADFGVSVKLLQSRVRMKPLPQVRQEFCLRGRVLGYSSTEIAAALNRDHTSVLYLLGTLQRKPSWEEGE